MSNQLNLVTMSEIKNSMAEIIISYLKDRYPNAKTTISKDAVIKALEHHSVSELYSKSIELFIWEDFMDTLYQIAANNCKVTFDDFKDFMDGDKVINFIDLYNITWIDLLNVTMCGYDNICQSVCDAIIHPTKISNN